MFIQLFTTSGTTSNSNLDRKELHQQNYVPMIVKIIGEWYKGQKQHELGERRVLTLTRIMLRQHKIFGEGIQKGKEMV
jgi:hypothetical protein